MKQLLILRHALALGTEVGGSDKTRKLSPNGIKDAEALGKLMAKDGLRPDAVLCSAATRTRQTLEGVMKATGETQVDYSEALYNADFTVLLNAVHDVPADVDTLLVVAHNPGVHTFAAQLADDDGSALLQRLLSGYAPATLSILDCDIEDWSMLKPFSNRLSALHETIDYNAPERPTRWM